jgi:hypothetical protein
MNAVNKATIKLFLIIIGLIICSGLLGATLVLLFLGIKFLLTNYSLKENLLTIGVVLLSGFVISLFCFNIRKKKQTHSFNLNLFKQLLNIVDKKKELFSTEMPIFLCQSILKGLGFSIIFGLLMFNFICVAPTNIQNYVIPFIFSGFFLWGMLFLLFNVLGVIICIFYAVNDFLRVYSVYAKSWQEVIKMKNKLNK